MARIGGPDHGERQRGLPHLPRAAEKHHLLGEVGYDGLLQIALRQGRGHERDEANPTLLMSKV